MAGKKPFSEVDGGIGAFEGMASPLNAQVPSKDPRSAVAKNTAFKEFKPRDPQGYLPGSDGE